MANRLAEFTLRTSENRLKDFSANRLEGFDPNRPLGVVEDIIPALDIPRRADPKDIFPIAPAEPTRNVILQSPRESERQGLIGRGFKQFVNKFFVEPMRTFLTEGGPGKLDTALRLAESGTMPEPSEGPRKFSLRELGAAIRESNRLSLEARKETRRVAEEFVPAFEVSPAETISEKGVDAVAGVTAFIGRLIATRKFLGVQRGDFTGSIFAWETENIATGGTPGAGAAMRLALGGIGSIPATTMVGKTAKLGVQSSLFGGLTAAAGGDWEEITISALIPLGFKAWNMASRGVAKGRAKRAITNLRTEGKKYGLNLANVPDKALDTIINAGKQAQFWNKQYAKGKVTEQVHEQRLTEIRGGIKPVIVAIARQQPIVTPKEKAQKAKAGAKALQKKLGISSEAANRAIEIAAKEGVAKADQFLSSVKAGIVPTVPRPEAELEPPPTEAIVAPEKPVEARKAVEAVEVSPEAKTEEQIVFGSAKQEPPVPPPIDITEDPPGEPTAEFGESFIKRVTRRAEEGLRAVKEYSTPASLVPLENEAISKLKVAVQLSQKETAVIAKEKKAYQRQRVAQAHRFLKAEKVKGELSAEERLAATVKFFKGEQYAKQRWEPIELDQATRNSMHEYIETHQGLQLHTKRNTSESLNKLFDGYYLTNHEVAYITDVFPELGKVAAKRRAPRNKAFDIFMSVLGFPKTVRAAFDISIMGRQMYPLLLGKPSLIAPGTRESLKLFFRKQSAAYATALSAEMRADPAWQRAKDMGVEVIEPGELSEEFPTRIAGKIPGIARSERAFVQVGNLLRVAAHDMIENAYITRGKPLSDDASKAMAQAINDLSGRASMPKNMEGLSLVASTIMWSPRLTLARAKAPFRMASRQEATRNLAIRSFTTMASFVTLMMVLAKYGHERNEDIDGELNPLATDFGKIRYKNQHIDTTGGYGPVLRTVARFATGLTKTAAGEITEKSRLETIKQFGRAKTAPAIGFARKVITQKDWLGRPAFRPPSGTIGEKMTEFGISDTAQIVAKELYEELLPLPMVDVADAAYIDGWASGLLAAPLAFGGIGTLTYEQMESTKLRIEQNKAAQREHGKQWDELGPLQQRFLKKDKALIEQQLKVDVEDLYQRQEYEVDKVRYEMYRDMSLSTRKELNSIGVAISAPARKSGDWRMNDVRYKHYVDKSTELMQQAFQQEFVKPYWQDKSTLLSFKQKRARQIMTNAKTKARNEVKRLSNEGKL